MLTILRRSVVASVFVAASSLPGCFSISVVPPRGELQPLPAETSAAPPTFAPNVPAETPSAWGRSLVFVLPSIDGIDPGWFLLDSGALVSTITGEAANVAGLDPVGTAVLQPSLAPTLHARLQPRAASRASDSASGGDSVTGADAVIPGRTTVFGARRLRLGPMTLEQITLVGLNFRNETSAFGREVCGIIGQEAFRGGVIILDPAREIVTAHDPAVPLDDLLSGEAAWIPLEMRHGLPHVRCRFPNGAEGLFLLDTGSDGSIDVAITSASRLGLDASSRSRAQPMILSDVVLGTQTLPWAAVTVDERAVDSAHAHDPDGPADGVIGMAFLRRFRAIFDQPHGRLALLPLSLLEHVRPLTDTPTAY